VRQNQQPFWAGYACSVVSHNHVVEITDLLRMAHQGDRESFNQVIPLLYQELKKLSAYHLRRECGPISLQTTALVHEAYLRLAKADAGYEGRTHFFAIASRVMRQVLVDDSRARAASKRGGGVEIQVAELSVFTREREHVLIKLDDALNELERCEPVKVQLIEMRYFGGMTLDESAAFLGLTLAVVRRELRLAQAWLRRELAS
jgi:RNA polymerase sigma-70 factor, ECF subfamily